MAATRKDRGNSWASRAPLNDDRAPIVAKLVEATFSSPSVRPPGTTKPRADKSGAGPKPTSKN